MNIMQTEATNAMRHSAMAMEAARRMRQTRQKRKTAVLVCHHLRMMLAASAGVAASPGLAASSFQLEAPAAYPAQPAPGWGERRQFQLEPPA